MVQDYSSSATFSWSTAGLVPGTYRFSVWARDASSGRTYDAYNSTLTLTLTTCRSVGVTVSPPSPATIGAAVSLTASAASCPNASPLYQFWVLAPGATAYTVAQAYSPSATFDWSTTGLPPGVYRFSVWVKDADSGGAAGNAAGRWDAYNSTVAYTLK
jgi:hypothetical protein